MPRPPGHPDVWHRSHILTMHGVTSTPDLILNAADVMSSKFTFVGQTDEHIGSLSSSCVFWNTSLWLTNEKPTWCHLLFYVTYYALNMFPTLIYPSSGACDCVDELPHRSSCSQFVVCWSFCCGWYLVVFVLQAEASACKLTVDMRLKRAYREVFPAGVIGIFHWHKILPIALWPWGQHSL